MKKKYRAARSTKTTTSTASQILTLEKSNAPTPANSYDASRVFMHMAYAARLRQSAPRC